MKYKPTLLEIFLTRLAFFLCGKSVYQTFAERLPLKGGERVLDFGCGMNWQIWRSILSLSTGISPALDMPNKGIIWFEHSGHNTWINEPAKFIREVLVCFSENKTQE